MGLTRLRAEQISDIDYKQAVRVVATTNITLSGGAPNSIDGVNLARNDRILVKAQDTASENGLYYVTTLGTGSNGTWSRTLDGNETGEIQSGMIVMVTEGDSFKDTQWKLTTNNPIVIGTTPLTFELNTSTNQILNGNSSISINNLGGNANVSIGGVANVAVFTTTGLTANNITTDGNIVVGNNLVVNGNLTYVNVTDLNIEDPIIGLGRGPNNTPLTTDDNKDRGTQLWYYTTQEQSAFVGWDDSAGKLALASNVTISNEIVTVNNYGNVLTGNIEATGNIMPTANVTYDLGSTSARWKDIWLSNSTIYMGTVVIGTVGNVLTVNGANVLTGNAGSTFSTTGNIIGGNLLTSGVVTATGNVTGGNILTAGIMSSTGNGIHGNILTDGLISATSTITSAANVIAGNISTAGLITATGNIQGGNVVLANGSLILGNVNVTTSNTIIQGWSYTGTSLSITATESNPQGIFFGNAGASFYVVGSTNDRVFQYNMSSVNMANTGTLFGNANVAAQDTTPIDLYIDSTGANLYVLGQTNDRVYQYTLSTPWNITTASFAQQSGTLTAQETTPTGVWFRPDLSTMYVVGTGNSAVYQYTLSSAGNIATASYASKSFSVSSTATNPSAVNLSSDGTKMWVMSSSISAIFEYNLATPWDVSTASYTLGNSFGVLAQEGTPTGLYVDADNSLVWVTGTTADTIFQYRTGNSVINQANALGVQGQFAVQGNAWFGQQVQIGGAIRSESTLTVDSTFTAGSTATFSTTTGTISIGTSQTTGNAVIGAALQTGFIQIGQSTANQTVQIANGAVGSGNTKTINIGTNGVAGSNTVITVGTNTGNGNVTFTANTTIAIANTGGSALSAAGNITGNNIVTAGSVTATGNITGNYFFGNGSQLTGMQSFVGATGPTGATGASGIQGLSGATGFAGATGTQGDIGATGASGIQGLSGATGASGVQGDIGATGPQGATGAFSGTLAGNIDGAGFNISNISFLSATGNVSSANVIATNLTGTLTTAAQTNITLLGTLSSLSVSGNVQGGNIRTIGLVSAAGNVQGGNILTTGFISATGNVTGNYFIGNGSQLSGINVDSSSISNGTSNVSIATANGNINMYTAGQDTVEVSPGELTVYGVFSNPKTITSNVVIGPNINSMLIGPIAVDPNNNIFVPTGSTLNII